MKLLRSLLLVLALATQLTAATAWKVTTWNLEWFPSGRADFTDAAVEARRTAEAAAVLRELDPDIILLQEIRDEAAVVALAKAIGRGHEVVVVSRFMSGEKLGQQQQAILAKFPAKAAYWRAWTTRQGINPTRGFSFALFPTPSGAGVAVYSVHLKSNSIRPDHPERQKAEALNRVQRELAAAQLVEHLDAIAQQPELAPAGAIVGGDFNTDPHQPRFQNERTIPGLEALGFRSPLRQLPLAERTTIPVKGPYDAATFDYIFLFKAAARGAPVIVPSEVADHRPVTVTVEVP